jgi:hypothetical protein
MRRAFLFWLTASVSAFALEPPPPYFEDAAQDSQGVVWAYSRAEYNQVYSFDGSQWNARGAPFEQSHNAMPAKVVRMADGAVACVWRYEDHLVAVTRHLGAESSLLGTCPGEIPASGLTVTPLADSQNRLWITGNFPKIYRADGKGGVTLVHEIKPDELRNPGNAREGYNKIHAVEDGHGRVWVWSDPEADNWASLRGVLIFTGDKAELRDPCSSLPGARILTIARADDRHMWIAVANDGIYKINLDTFDLQRMSDPSPKALCCVHEIFVNGGDVYAVEYLPRVQDALWRLRDGKWAQLVPHLDVHSNSWLPRFWLPIKEGLLVGSFGNGPWFIPKHGTPALFSWRSGFPFEDMHALCRFADGTFFGISRGDQLFHGALPLPPHDRKNSRIVEIEPDQGWVFAATGHAWMIPRNPPLALKEWDGLKWITHELPAGTKYASGLNEDDQGRLWLYSQSTLIFDPRSGQWQSFPKMEDAFLAFKDKPVQFRRDEWFLTPQYSADHKRIAYRRGVIEINYFDGANWQKWMRSQIVGKNDGDNAVGPPWFDENGKLHVNLRNKMSWQMDDAGKWSQIAWVGHFPDDIWSENQNARNIHPAPPDGCVTNQPESIVVDNLGTTWLTWKGGLYKCIPGLCVEVFGADEINPFRTKRMLRETFVDSQGNAFLLTASSEMDRMMLRPKSPAPVTHIVMKRKAEDAFEARLDARTKQKVTFRWQLDEGPWQLSKTNSLALDHLPNGPHVLNVTAIDDQLNMDAVPATAKFETKIDPSRQMALLVAQLFDHDFSKREIAVEALARQPTTALPALRKARETATDDERWWIDAAIQECERQTTSPKR